VGVIGAPSTGIELVLGKNYRPVAQIRVRCKNVPQVNMTNKMTFSQGKMEILDYQTQLLIKINLSGAREKSIWLFPFGGI
jgi:hypothetical protein